MQSLSQNILRCKTAGCMGMGMGSSLDALMFVEFSDNSDVYIIVVSPLKDYLSWSKHKTAVSINIQLTKKILRPSPLFLFSVECVS